MPPVRWTSLIFRAWGPPRRTARLGAERCQRPFDFTKQLFDSALAKLSDRDFAWFLNWHHHVANSAPPAWVPPPHSGGRIALRQPATQSVALPTFADFVVHRRADCMPPTIRRPGRSGSASCGKVVLLVEFGFELLDLGLLGLFDALGLAAVGEVEVSVLEELLEPVMELGGVDVEFIAQVGDWDLVDEVPFEDGDLLGIGK